MKKITCIKEKYYLKTNKLLLFFKLLFYFINQPEQLVFFDDRGLQPQQRGRRGRDQLHPTPVLAAAEQEIRKQAEGHLRGTEQQHEELVRVQLRSVEVRVAT